MQQSDRQKAQFTSTKMLWNAPKLKSLELRNPMFLYSTSSTMSLICIWINMNTGYKLTAFYSNLNYGRKLPKVQNDPKNPRLKDSYLGARGHLPNVMGLDKPPLLRVCILNFCEVVSAEVNSLRPDCTNASEFICQYEMMQLSCLANQCDANNLCHFSENNVTFNRRLI